MMIASTTLQSRILKMRKRLSDSSWQTRALHISIIGVLLILSLVIRATYISSSYGIVDSEIPAARVELNDPDNMAYKEPYRSHIGKITPVVVLTPTEFIFTDISGISSKLEDPRLRFSVPHTDGSPNITELLIQMAKWIHQRRSQEIINTDGNLILLPTGQVPMPIVIQTMHYLKRANFISTVILANGLL